MSMAINRTVDGTVVTKESEIRALTRQSFEGVESRTQQQFKDECDVNNIVAKYQRTGVVEHANRYQASYGDVSGYDFTEAQNLVAAVTQQFETLPSTERKAFGNDPAEYLAYVSDPANAEDAKSRGLLVTQPPAQEPSAASAQARGPEEGEARSGQSPSSSSEQPAGSQEGSEAAG